MAEEREKYQVPPTRPSTPLTREPRIAEAPSRADPNLPLVETSSPSHATVAMAQEERDRVTYDLADHNEDSAQNTTTVSARIHFLVNHLFPPCSSHVAFAGCTKLFQNLPLSTILPFTFHGRSCLWKDLGLSASPS
jgi:hypothetical protein